MSDVADEPANPAGQDEAADEVADDPAQAETAPQDHGDLRALLTKWSGSGDPAYRRVVVKNLGNRVELENVVRTPFAVVELQVQRLVVHRTPFDVPAPDAPDGVPVATGLEAALATLPPFEAPAGALEGDEESEHLAWRKAVPCGECSNGRARCETCAGEGRVACECGSGTVDVMVEAMAECVACSGSGKTPPRVCIPCGGSGAVECGWCRGTGRGPLREPCEHCTNGRNPCGHCIGTGEVFGRCATCGGPGKLMRRVPEGRPCPICEGSASVPCTACGQSGERECERCKGSGQFVRGEVITRSLRIGELRRLRGDAPVEAAIEEAALAAAVPFVLRDLEAAEGIAARLGETPGVAAAFLEAARDGLAAGAAVYGRFGTANAISLRARLGTWTASFAGVEAGARKSFECTSGQQPPIDPKTYGRFVSRENAARTAAYEEAAAAAEGVYHAALEQWKKEVAEAQVAAAAPVASVPAPAAEPEPFRISWGRGLDEPGDAREPEEKPKEKRGRFGLFRGRRAKDDEALEPEAVAPTPAPEPVLPAIPAPVRREVPAPELLPGYEVLPETVRIS